MAEKYAGHTKDITKQGGSTVQDIHGKGSVQTAEHNLRVSIQADRHEVTVI